MPKKAMKRCPTCVSKYDKPGKIAVEHGSGDPKKRKFITCFKCHGKGKVPVDG